VAAGDITPSSGSWVALYVTDESKPAALCVADGPLAANSSAALSMLPPNTAKDAIKSKDLPSAMVANLREIMNICSRLLMTDSSPHLRLAALHAVKSMPADLSAVIGSAHNRFDFEIQVPKYGVGNLAFIST
jgi:hypothetical protein